MELDETIANQWISDNAVYEEDNAGTPLTGELFASCLLVMVECVVWAKTSLTSCAPPSICRESRVSLSFEA